MDDFEFFLIYNIQMSNNNFFQSFFTNNKLWNEIQNNPIAHQYLFPHKIPFSAQYHLTNTAGQKVTTLHRYTQRRRYYPPPEPTRRTRVRVDHVTGLIDSFPKSVKHLRHLQKYILDKHAENIPAPGVNLQSYVAMGLTPAQRTETSKANANAMLGKGYYDLVNVDYYNDDDYWLPNYEGNFLNLSEKASRKLPHSYNKDAKFLPKNQYLAPKQKEALVWLNANFS